MADDTPTDEVPAATPEEQTAPRSANGFYVPKWLAILVAALVIGGGGFGIGYAVAPGDDRGEYGISLGEGGPTGRLDDLQGRLPRLLREFLERGGPGLGRDMPKLPDGRTPAEEIPFLGVGLEPAAGGVAGALVSGVAAGSPADDAGLEVGDVITAFEGDDVKTPADLVARVLDHEPGDEVTIAYRRGGETKDVRVKLGMRSDAARPSAQPAVSPVS